MPPVDPELRLGEAAAPGARGEQPGGAAVHRWPRASGRSTTTGSPGPGWRASAPQSPGASSRKQAGAGTSCGPGTLTAAPSPTARSPIWHAWRPGSGRDRRSRRGGRASRRRARRPPRGRRAGPLLAAGPQLSDRRAVWHAGSSPGSSPTSSASRRCRSWSSAPAPPDPDPSWPRAPGARLTRRARIGVEPTSTPAPRGGRGGGREEDYSPAPVGSAQKTVPGSVSRPPIHSATSVEAKARQVSGSAMNEG
jgi:hypothetical protein